MLSKRTILLSVLVLAPATCFPQFDPLPSATVRGSRIKEMALAPVISADARLVIVPVQVADRSGTPVNDLKAASFQVFDNKIEQPIVSFGADDSPCSVGIVLDFSGSMAGKNGISAAALRQFLETANPKDEFLLLTVSTRPEEISGFTRNSANLQSALVLARPAGATALNDTIRLGLSRMRSAQNQRKALVVVSDGMDNHSRTTASELLRVIEESDVQIYTIGVENRNPWEKPVELAQEKSGLEFLRSLAARSGGLNWTTSNVNEMPEIVARLSQAVREQYIIGYRPPAGPASGQWRSIQVKVDQHQLRVSARAGYYSR
jgi:Ca-activated chloride channel family protein